MTQTTLWDQTPDYRALDDANRRVIREALGETLFVEAGAGTGKTRALVDRIVALVLSGVPVERLAAITFTERAAAELRERVRSGLETELREHPERAGVIDPALASLDRAQISTIHSFCQAIVRTYAAEAGVDPDFAVQDEVMTQRRMQERWRAFLEQLGDDADARRAIDRLLSLGLRTGDLETLALALASRGEVAEIIAAQPLDPPAPEWPDIPALHQRLHALGLDTVAPDDRLRLRIEGVLSVLEALLARPAEEHEEILGAGAAALDEGYKGLDGNWGGRQRKLAALDTLTTVCDQFNATLSGLRSSALAAVMPRLLDFVRGDEAARGHEGALTFDDLILRARRLLATSLAAVRSLRHRYHALLIDEFQDTDPLQVHIALAFATDPDNDRLEPGRLFLVGDPKQSIYRFRRADMATYAHTRNVVEDAGAAFPRLALNRRSRAPVLAWVNSVFDRVIGPGAEPDVQPPYHAIHPDRAVELAGPGVAWFGGPSADKAREIRTREAADIAALCRRAIEERWQVADRDTPGTHVGQGPSPDAPAGDALWTPRNARFRDIAVLIPRRIGLTSLERAMAAAGVPYRVEGGSLIYRTQEVRDLINCLTAIDDPADEVAVVAALRSPAFACSDVDLARHRAAGHRFDYQHSELDTWEGPVAGALRALAAFHRERHEASLASLVERFVIDRGTIETGILDQADRNSFRRARFMVERARTFEAAGPESLRAFVAWLERQSEAAMLDNEGAGVDDDEDAVRILTIHGAKGLEFPIVFLAGLGAAPLNLTPTYSADFTGERAAVCIGTKSGNRRFTLGDFEALSHRNEAHERAELDRLLYVAATRARDHLVVSLHHSARVSACLARRLIDAGSCEAAPELLLDSAGQAPESRGQALSPTGGGAESPLAGLTVDLPPGLSSDTFAEQRAALLAASRTRRFTSATALGRFRKEEATDETEPWAHGRGGTRLGRAVHAAVQSLPLDADDAAIAAHARAQAVAEAIPHRRRDVERLVRWIVRESEAWARAKAAPRVMREVPFALEDGGVVLEGFVDLVIQTPDGIEIVDWKTDQIAPAEVPDRLAEYTLQAGLYVLGLQTATGLPVTRVTYVFASAATELSPGEPAALAAAARAELTTA